MHCGSLGWQGGGSPPSANDVTAHIASSSTVARDNRIIFCMTLSKVRDSHLRRVRAAAEEAANEPGLFGVRKAKQE